MQESEQGCDVGSLPRLTCLQGLTGVRASIMGGFLEEAAHMLSADDGRG